MIIDESMYPLIFVAICILLIVFFMYRFMHSKNKNFERIIEMAKKIDPSVETIEEANYVLTKDIAKNIGNNDEKK